MLLECASFICGLAFVGIVLFVLIFSFTLIQRRLFGGSPTD